MSPMELLTCSIPSWPVQPPALHTYPQDSACEPLQMVCMCSHRGCIQTPTDGTEYQQWAPFFRIQGTNHKYFKALPWGNKWEALSIWSAFVRLEKAHKKES